MSSAPGHFTPAATRLAGGRPGTGWRRARGVTLIELLVVMVLIGAVLTVTLPVFSKGAQSLEVRAAARQVYGVLRMARSHAIARAERAVVLIDDEARLVSLLRSRVAYALPRGVQLDLDRQGLISKRVVFYPDGSATAASLALGNGHKRYRIDVESLTGQVSVDADSSDIAQRL